MEKIIVPKDKYAGDKYNRELYIPKGYILPDGSTLTKSYARFHEDMARRFIEENYHTSYNNDFIKDYKDYMLMRIHALQVLSCGKPIILHCEDHLTKQINDAIVSYLSYGWQEEIIFNLAASNLNYIRAHFFFENGCFELLYGGDEDEKEIAKQNVLKRC